MQIVLLGVGYDTRALRFPGTRTTVFEVDTPQGIARRRAALRGARLPTPPNGRMVGVDFECEALSDVLVAHGAERGRPTVVLLEGVSMYLSRAAMDALLADVRDLGGSGCTVALDVWDPAPPAVVVWGLRQLGEPVRSGATPATLPRQAGPCRVTSVERDGWATFFVLVLEPPAVAADVSEAAGWGTT